MPKVTSLTIKPVITPLSNGCNHVGLRGVTSSNCPVPPPKPKRRPRAPKAEKKGKETE